MLHLTELRNKPEMAGNAFCRTIDSIMHVGGRPDGTCALAVSSLDSTTTSMHL